MAFMKPQVYFDQYYHVETNIGSEIVPADLISLPFAVNFKAGGYFDPYHECFPSLARALTPYCEGTSISNVQPRQGFLARMSAPGYLDCTEWSVHATEQKARDFLFEMYGDDDE